jgi:hypothetical protein
VWLVVISALVLIAISNAGDAATKAGGAASKARTAASQSTTALQGVQSGRRVSLGATCAALNAVIEAGRGVIINAANSPETLFTRRLEKLGYPPPRVRTAQAKVASASYAASIVDAVQAQLGSTYRLINQRTGTINCDRLERIGHAG